MNISYHEYTIQEIIVYCGNVEIGRFILTEGEYWNFVPTKFEDNQYTWWMLKELDDKAYKLNGFI